MLNSTIAEFRVGVLLITTVALFAEGSGSAREGRDLSKSARPLTKPNVLFYAPFDGTFDAQVAKGGTKLDAPTKAGFVEGHSGQAVLVGGPGSELNYLTEGNFDLNAGTLAMWVKPIGWGKADTYSRFYFRLHEATVTKNDTGNFIWLYKPFIYPVNWLVQQEGYRRTFYSNMPTSGDLGGKVKFELLDGQWGHLIATWAGNQTALYANGQLVGATYVPTPRLIDQPAETFIIGGQNRRDNGVQDTAIDDVLILNQPVAPAEAKAIYEKGLAAIPSAATDESAPFFSVRASHQLRENKIAFITELVGWTTNDLADASYQYEVQDPKTAKALWSDRVVATGLRQRFLVDAPAVPIGSCPVRVQLMKGDRLVSTVKTSLEVSAKPEWLGNQMGVVKSVPSPWEPLCRRENTITCWGREYSWKQGAWPAQIISQGRKMLSRPISLMATVDGELRAIDNAPIQWNSISPLRADFTVKGKLGEIPVTIKGYLEYDGFLWQDIMIGESSSTGTLDQLVLEIPMCRAAATLMTTDFSIQPSSGAVIPFSSNLGCVPVVWLGNERGGLQWSAQDFKDWNLRNKRQMMTVKPDNEETLLQFTFIDTPTELKGVPLQYSFGLQATPVKPLPSDWRAWELELLRGCTWDLNALPDNERSARTWTQWAAREGQRDSPYGYLVANPNTFVLYTRLNAKNLFPYIYWNSGAIWSGDDVLQTFADWGEYQPNAYEYTSVPMRRSNPDMRDYMVWRCNQLFEDNPRLVDMVSGYYLDCAQAVWDNDELYSLLGTRDFQRRAYLSVKAKWPQIKFFNHQSGTPTMSQLAFADLMVTGEHFACDSNLIADLNYYHVLTLEKLRAEYLGSAFGIPMVFLPEISRTVEGDEAKVKSVLGPQGIPAVEHLVGMLWVHDIPYTRDCVNGLPMLQAYRVKMAFGWDADTVFKGYWENADCVTAKADKSPVVTSLFLHKGRALFVIMNNSDEEARVTLKPNWNRLDIAVPATLVDAYAEKGNPPSTMAAPVVDGEAALVVKARNFRALVAR